MISRCRSPRKPQRKPKPSGRAGLHLPGEAGVVQAQARDGGAQVFEVGGVGGEQAAEHHRLHLLEAGQRLGGGAALVGQGVAHRGVGHLLDGGGEEADLAGAEARHVGGLGVEHAHLVDAVAGAGVHQPHLLAGGERAVDHPHQHHHAEVGVVPGVDQERFQGGRAVALGGRQAGDDGLQRLGDAQAGLGGGEHGVGGVDADHLLDLRLDALDVGGGQVDLVEHRHDLVVVLDRLVDVGERLRLDPLGGVDHEQGSLARGQAAADLVGEIDVAGGVDQVEHIVQAVVGAVVQPHGLRLDGDAALALDRHAVQHLGGHLARGQPAGGLDQPVRQRRLAVVNVRHD